jgi:hypothetical protein
MNTTARETQESKRDTRAAKMTKHLFLNGTVFTVYFRQGTDTSHFRDSIRSQAEEIESLHDSKKQVLVNLII